MNQNDQEFLLRKIRTQYTEKEPSRLDELKKLDAAVKRPALVLAYGIGAVGALLLGGGMSLVMTDLGVSLGLADPMLSGIVTGVAGLLLMIFNYPLYRGVLGARRRKYANRVLTLSEEIQKG